jgi:hypothetical protein
MNVTAKVCGDIDKGTVNQDEGSFHGNRGIFPKSRFIQDYQFVRNIHLDVIDRLVGNDHTGPAGPAPGLRTVTLGLGNLEAFKQTDSICQQDASEYDPLSARPGYADLTSHRHPSFLVIFRHLDAHLRTDALTEPATDTRAPISWFRHQDA